MSDDANSIMWRLLNRLHGHRFWLDKDGAVQFTKGTCPYPVHQDWSAKGCIRRGDCGCENRRLSNRAIVRVARRGK